MPEFSPIVALMREFGAPLTRDEYLRWNSLGKPKKLTAEGEADLPSRFAYPVVSHEELPEASSAASDEGKGAPADFAGPVFPNPDNVQPLMDNELPKRPTALPPGTMLDKSLGGKPKMDISNPVKAQVVPNEMTPYEQ